MAADFKLLSWDDPRWEDAVEFPNENETNDNNQPNDTEHLEQAPCSSKSTETCSNDNADWELDCKEWFDESNDWNKSEDNSTKINQDDETKHKNHEHINNQHHIKPNNQNYRYNNRNENHFQNRTEKSYIQGNTKNNRHVNQNITESNESSHYFDNKRNQHQGRFIHQYTKNNRNENYSPNLNERSQFRGNYKNKEYYTNRQRNNYNIGENTDYIENESNHQPGRSNRNYNFSPNHMERIRYRDNDKNNESNTNRKINKNIAVKNYEYYLHDDRLIDNSRPQNYQSNNNYPRYNNRNENVSPNRQENDSNYRRNVPELNHVENGKDKIYNNSNFRHQRKDTRFNTNEERGFASRGNNNYKDRKGYDDDDYKEEYRKFDQIYRNKHNSDSYFEWKSGSGYINRTDQSFHENNNNDTSRRKYDDSKNMCNNINSIKSNRKDNWDQSDQNQRAYIKHDNRPNNERKSLDMSDENMSRLFTRFHENIHITKDKYLEGKLPKQYDNQQHDGKFPDHVDRNNRNKAPDNGNRGGYRRYDAYDNHDVNNNYTRYQKPSINNKQQYDFVNRMACHDEYYRGEMRDGGGMFRRPDRRGYRGGNYRGRNNNRTYHLQI